MEGLKVFHIIAMAAMNLIFAFMVDVCILVMTNLMSIPCCRAMRRSGVFSRWVSVLLFLCQFIFCVDVIIAIIYFVKTKNKICGKNMEEHIC
jgi:hypothetical protein